MKMIWGISKIRDFEQCQRMFHAKHVEKTNWVDVPSPAVDRGRRMHKVMEDGIKYGVVPPDDMQHMMPTLTKLLDMRDNGFDVRAEHKFGVTDDYGKADFFKAPGLRVRVALDVLVRNNEQAKLLLIDWKTGKPKPEHTEDALFYGACSVVAHDWQPVTAQYHYLDRPSAGFSVDIAGVAAARKILDRWWQKFQAAEDAMERWGVREEPGRQCSWCGAKSCPHNTNKALP